MHLMIISVFVRAHARLLFPRRCRGFGVFLAFHQQTQGSSFSIIHLSCLFYLFLVISVTLTYFFLAFCVCSPPTLPRPRTCSATGSSVVTPSSPLWCCPTTSSTTPPTTPRRTGGPPRSSKRDCSVQKGNCSFDLTWKKCSARKGREGIGRDGELCKSCA